MDLKIERHRYSEIAVVRDPECSETDDMPWWNCRVMGDGSGPPLIHAMVQAPELQDARERFRAWLRLLADTPQDVWTVPCAQPVSQRQEAERRRDDARHALDDAERAVERARK